MNLKKIIREEMDNDLLMEGKLNDMFKKFNMTHIKKELKKRLDIDETSTKMEVAKKLIKYSYKLNLKLLKYELGAVLGGFIFYFLSIVLDVIGVEPFVTDGEPTMPHFILWGAGALLNVIRMVRKDLKEENGLQWIKDVKSNKDIAQEIADETKIKNGRLYPPYLPPYLISINPLFFFSLSRFSSLFTKYCKEQYGLDNVNANDVWERYKDIVKDKINDHSNINESNELQWIKDTLIPNEYYEFLEEAKDKYGYGPINNSDVDIILGIKKPPTPEDIDWARDYKRYLINYFAETEDYPIEMVEEWFKEIYSKGINESDELQWIKDIKPTLNDAFEQGTLKVGDVLTLSGDLADCDAKTTKEVNDFKIKIVKLKGNINNSYFIPLQKKYWEHLEYEGKGNTRFYRSDGKMRIEDQHNEL
tara:strand:- start:112 stop:1365 length:1254 start_codon:yes stop_codon:yes gene_type:complete